MNPNHELKCFIIGEGTLPIRCAEILLNHSHQLCGFISSDSSSIKWAKSKNIRIIDPTNEELNTVLSEQPFDCIFSIVNPWILSKEILALPLKWAVNYHDSLLPKYAGTHATSWALINRETTYGITWHAMNEVVDSGDILKQRCFQIANDETALTLNAKCYEAAIDAFGELVTELGIGTLLPRKQDLKQRSFFAKDKKPPRAGVISWDRPARDIDALVRALDFGAYPNRLGSPKLIVSGRFFVVPEVEVLDSACAAPPGTISAISDDCIRISTASEEVALRKVLTIDGRPLAIRDFVSTLALEEGFCFQNVDDETAERLEKLERAMCRHEAFWVSRLSALQPLSIPYACGSAKTNRADCEQITATVAADVSHFLLTRQPNWPMTDFLMAAFLVYLARLAGVQSFDVGFKHPKSRPDISGLEGFFSVNVPLHFEVNDDHCFSDLFSAQRKQADLVRANKTFARDLMVRYPFLQSTTSLQSAFRFPVTIELAEKLDQHAANTEGELTIVIATDGSGIRWIYDPDKLEQKVVARMMGQFATFLEGVIANPAQPINTLPILSKEERNQLFPKRIGAHDHPLSTCLHERFEEQAARKPDSIAVVCEANKITYGELNQRANQLGHYLRELGIGPEHTVGLYLERSVDLVVAVLGILKAGGAYVPIDSTFPKERVALMLEEADATVVVTQQSLLPELPESARRNEIVCLDSDWRRVELESTANPGSVAAPDNLAYIIFTSGSTGRPKGVMVSHRNVTRLFEVTERWFHFGERDVWTLFHSIAFDFSVWELFGTLLYGGRLVVVPYWVSRAPEALYQLLRDERVTILNQTPSAFRQLMQVDQSTAASDLALRTVIFGGESLELRSLKPWFDRHGDQAPELVNMYGITETTVHVTYRSLSSADGDMGDSLIGGPLPDLEVYVLDRHLQPVPFGLPGELHVGGAGLARGYLNRPELTNERFIKNPFNSEPGARLYKSGDLVRYLPSGDLIYLGRVDNQVKIRGFRIELGEIEAMLGQHAAVQMAVVLASENDPGDKRLVAYVKARKDALPKASDLRSFLKKKLPDYMVPAAFVFLDELPLTPNGKLDRAALPDPDSFRAEPEVTYEPPNAGAEQKIAGIWQDVLRIGKVSANDNFFDLGGHSLLMTQVQTKLREAFDREVPVVDLFRYPTVSALAGYLSQTGNGKDSLQRVNARARARKDALAQRRQPSEKRRT